MDPNGHAGESAELYALGALDERETRELEAHIAKCAACLQRVGEAEATLLALERENVPVPNAMPAPHFAAPRAISTPRWWYAASIAAALIAGWLLPRPAVHDDAATLAMIGSHFSHAQFAGNGPPAKLIYARDRSWYYVIVSGSRRFDVDGVRGAQSSPLGSTASAGTTSQLFVRSRAQFDRIELRDGGRLVESAVVR